MIDNNDKIINIYSFNGGKFDYIFFLPYVIKNY